MKILVIALAGIGDCLIATPLIHELRLHYPEADLQAFVFWKGSKELLDQNPHINKVFAKNLVKEGRFKALRYLLSLRKERYDITINAHPQGRFEYRAAAGLIGGRLRLSHSYESRSPIDRFLVNRTIPQDYNLHSVENNNRLLSLLEKRPLLKTHELEMYLTAAETEWAKSFVQNNQLGKRKRLGIHVGSGGTKNLALKRWPLANYIEFLKGFTRRHPETTVLLFGGPEEEKAHQEIQAAVNSPGILPAKTENLRQAAALMQHCDGFLSVDTALMHLAAAMKVPNQVVIEAPTLNKTNMPMQPRFTIIPNPMVNGRNLDYYRYDGKNIKGGTQHLIDCMNSIKVEAVLDTVSKVIGQVPPR